MIEQKLLKALDKVNKEYFNFEQVPSIKLSKGQDKQQRKMIVFGTYHARKNEIRIHPVLVQDHIADFVLEFIIYHEMLHYQDREFLLTRKKGQTVHDSAFRQRERQFIEYTKAQEILKEILHGKTIVQDHEIKKTKVKGRITTGLSGKVLENALVESLKRLENVFIKYNMIEEKSKGGKRGSKKRNEKD